MFKNDTDHFDQHFLVDQKVIDKFIKEANLNKEDIVVEIGPGNGVLTKIIAPQVKKLYVIELDQRLKDNLEALQRKNKNIELIFDNCLNTYIPPCDKIITSLPYSIIEPFINKLVKCEFKEIIMITGNNYANNVLENKNKLALLTNSHFKFTKIMEILPESFNPKPRVLSALIKLEKKEPDDLLLKIFKNLFYYQDKKLKNALIETFINVNLVQTKREAKELISKLEITNLEKNFEVFSNQEIQELHKQLEKII